MKRSPTREARIRDEIIVDAHEGSEQAMGWYYYLEGMLHFPFEAQCVAKRETSPRNRPRPDRGRSTGTRAIPRLRRFAAALGMTSRTNPSLGCAVASSLRHHPAPTPCAAPFRTPINFSTAD